MCTIPQAGLIVIFIANGCASEAVIKQKQEACSYILSNGEPNVHDARWKGMSDTDFKAAKAWWNDCNINATEETKTQSKSASLWDKVDKYISQEKYSDAWALISTLEPEDEEKTKYYLARNPKLHETALNQFSIDSITRKKQSGYDAAYLFNQLEKFKKYSKSNEYNVSKYNVELVFQKEIIGGKVLDKVLYGRISGIQFEDNSHINLGTGANLGALAGQAIYIDNTTWRNYSGINQLGAGLLGAMVGSSLDQPTSIQYKRTYWITLNTGETISITSNVLEKTHIPHGICVEVKGTTLMATNELKCKTRRDA